MRVRQAREGDAPAIARAFIDSFRSAHRAHIPEAALLELSYEQSERNWARSLRAIAAEGPDSSQQCIYVAEEPGGQISGVAMGGPETTNHPQYAGEVYVLNILPTHHRQGLGRRLMQVVARHLARHDMHSLLVRVLSANAPARAFYEVLGGQLVLQEQIEAGGAQLDQVAYGWPDTSQLSNLRSPNQA